VIIIYTALAMQIPLLFVFFIIRILAERKAQILNCTECQRCAGACPVLKRKPEFIGPYGVMLAAKKGLETGEGHLELCQKCGLCVQACPRGLDILETLDRLSPSIVTPRHRTSRRLVSLHRDHKNIPWEEP